MINRTISISRSLSRGMRSCTTVLLFLGTTAFTATSLGAVESAVKYYRIPAGDAVTTLQQLVDQSGAQIIYLVNKVAGVTTNTVEGTFTTRNALDVMLAGTGLVHFSDTKSDAITINQVAEPILHPPRNRTPETRSPHINAESPGEVVVKLSTFSVLADAYKGYMASSTLIGGKAARAIIEVPQTVHVITRDLIDDMGSDSPTDALIRIAPGTSAVSSEPSSGAGVYIRGFRAQNWSVDGATMRTISFLSNFNVDAIEVIKGPASVTFGAFAAYGGYVSILPKYAHRNLQQQVSLSLGTDNYYSGMIDIGGELGESGNLQYRLVLGALNTDRAGWNYDFQRVQMVAPSFAYDFSDRSRLKFRFELTNTEGKNSTTAMDANGTILLDFSANGPDSPKDHYNQEDGQSMQMVWETEFNDQWSAKFNLFGALGEKTYDQISLTGGAPAQTYTFNSLQRDQWWKNFYADYSVSWKIDEIAKSGISVQTVGSLSLDHWDSSYRFWDSVNVPVYNTLRIDPTNPDWSLYPTERPTYPTRFIYYNTEWLGGAVIESALGFFNDKLVVSAATRFNYDNRSLHNSFRVPQNQDPGGTYPTPPDATKINEKVTKRFGIVYKPTDRMSVYAGSTEAFLAVGAIFKADGSPLVPETGKNEEIGVKLDLIEAFGGNFSFTGALFRINVVNKWRNDPNNPGFFIQDGAQGSEGVDLQLSYTSQKLSFIAGFFHARGPYDKLTGERAVVVPDLTYNLWLKYNLTERLNFGGGLKYAGDTISNDRRFTRESYTTADLFLGYTMPVHNGTMSYRLGITNLTNDDAVTIISNAASLQREEGRRVKLTATYSW